MGEARAPVAVIAFSEFRCPYCKTFSERTLPELVERFIRPGKVLLSFRHLPLDSMHPDARKGAELAACAAESNKFWQVHDAFFRMPKDGDFRAEAEKNGLSGPETAGCQDRGSSRLRVRNDVELGRSLKIKGTPTFLVGRNLGGMVKVHRMLRGARPVDDFAAVFAELNK